MVEIETENWKIFFDEQSLKENLGDGFVKLVFRIKGRKNIGREITEEEFDELKKNLHDLGKWEDYKKLHKELND